MSAVRPAQAGGLTYGNIDWCGPGAVCILCGARAQRVRPGGGADLVVTGGGDDVILLCDGAAGLVVDGGSGRDRLLTPLSASKLAPLGVLLVDIEDIEVRSDAGFLVECGQ